MLEKETSNSLESVEPEEEYTRSVEMQLERDLSSSQNSVRQSVEVIDEGDAPKNDDMGNMIKLTGYNLYQRHYQSSVSSGENQGE